MIFRKIFRVIGWTLVTLIGLLILFLAVSVAPLDRTPMQDRPEYAVMMQRLDSLQKKSVKATAGFAVGFSKVNFTPAHPVALAGYGNRKGKAYTSVLDSIYIRTMVVDNGTTRVAIVAADLIIIPPTVTELLETKLPDVGFTLENTFLGATHTHNSIGQWGKGATQLLYGKYEDTTVHFIANKILESIRLASANVTPATIKTGNIPTSRSILRNRIEYTGNVDSLLRVIEIQRSDSTRLLLMSYTGHATCLFSRDLVLSRDYPGKLVDDMETSGYTFAMFMAGAVGSHACNPPEGGTPCIGWVTDRLEKDFIKKKDLEPLRDTSLAMYRVRLELPPPDAKILKDWRLRPWLFRSALGEFPVYITALRMGELIMLGTPCDFSGELDAPLDSLSHQLDKRLMITSFNGGYIGYITADKYYDVDHHETRLMNWYGPGNGKYFTECLSRIITTIQ